MTETSTVTRPSTSSTQVAPSRLDAGDADIFLKRSAPYYHAQPSSHLDSAHAASKQRDPMLAETLQSLAPPDARFSPASMHARLQTAQQTLTTALAHLQSNNKHLDKSLIANTQTLQREIKEALTLQQEASDNQRLLIQA